jgi:hypothetical protein
VATIEDPMETTMATDLLDLPRGTMDFPRRAGVSARPAFRHFQVLLRQWRRQRWRRRLLAGVLAETTDPRLIVDAGLRPPAPSMLEGWAQALLDNYQSSHR